MALWLEFEPLWWLFELLLLLLLNYLPTGVQVRSGGWCVDTGAVLSATSGHSRTITNNNNNNAAKILFTPEPEVGGGPGIF